MKKFAIILLGVVLACGCARSIILLDKTDYHYQNGLKFLSQNNIEGAKIEFEYAIFLDDTFAPAHVGLAIVHGTTGNLDKAVDSMKKAQQLYRNEKKETP